MFYEDHGNDIADLRGFMAIAMNQMSRVIPTGS